MGHTVYQRKPVCIMRAFVAISSLLAACRAEASLPLAASYGYAAPVSAYATPGAVAHAAATYGAAPLVRSYAAPAIAPIAAAPAVAVKAAPAVTVAAAPAVPSVTSTQYRAGDEFGNDAFGYSNVNSARQETRSNGAVSGSYSYVDEAGVHTRNYVADAFGFRVTGDNLPVAPAAVIAHRRRRSILAGRPLSDAERHHAATYGVIPQTGIYAPGNAAGVPALPAVPVAPFGNTYTVPAVAPVTAPIAVAPVASATIAAAGYTVPSGIANRDAVLTTIKLNPGHATAYRVD